MLWSLFYSFLKIGFISFGGGYAMIPAIEHEVRSHQWLTSEEFVNTVAVAGMSPGPIATNTATIIGFNTAGITGAIASTLGMVLPSFLIITLLASIFLKISQHKITKSLFYGLKPVTTGLILYAAIHFGVPDQQSSIFTWNNIGLLIIVLMSLIAIIRFRIHPFVVIVASGFMGVVLFGDVFI